MKLEYRKDEFGKDILLQDNGNTNHDGMGKTIHGSMYR